jgi:hypothetical protein
VFVLARRERVELLRPYLWDDPDSDYLQENLRRRYYQVKDDVPNPENVAIPKSSMAAGSRLSRNGCARRRRSPSALTLRRRTTAAHPAAVQSVPVGYFYTR